ncbi:Cyclic di-GMP phosphodiesterase response regulator RpfG [Bacillus sp. THAF10]|uniref:HD-GYP domain-containing protein n=1 Tax=Bacillus sp. THAF10 TaxID=2587848 RepID=UPI0012A94D81|nr:HD-GYP domain-containing protein [Bacillus sp. THAF10]QFT88667.1 Cyclic di-GMP phosphodiesterase response regulator RpfG [Bacillus sp. THAF10]
MHISIYSQFIKRLIINYLIGSSIAVLGVGSVLIFTTLDLSEQETYMMATILIVSAAIMFICELSYFHHQLKPVKKIFSFATPSVEQYHAAFVHLQRFPLLTVKRILGPHLLGLSVPAVLLVLISIKFNFIELPYKYVIFACLGAVLIAGMHAFIEYFLTIKAIQPILISIQEKAQETFHSKITLNGDIIVSLRSKFLVGALFVGIFPVLLFSLATQVRFEVVLLSINFWSWAFFILLIATGFSIFGAFLLFRDIIKPINQLVTGMEKVKDNDLSTTNELYSDEFSKVIKGFNSMVTGLQERNEINRLLLESFYQTLSTTLDARDPYTAGHSLRVSQYSLEIGRRANLSDIELECLKNTALLHDIGKIGIRDSVLLKDGKLTDEEFEQIKKHPALGATILGQVQPKEAMSPLIPGVRSHHERYDGRGYPDRLSGEDIPVFGRIIAVADAFDAMTSDRPYRKGMNMDKALNILIDGKGTQWDPFFVDIFYSIMSEKSRKSKRVANE